MNNTDDILTQNSLDNDNPGVNVSDVAANEEDDRAANADGYSAIINCLGELSGKITELTSKVTVLSEKMEAAEKKNFEICENVERLRDQMFTLGMAEVTESGVTKNESYNNLILDEVCALRGDMDGLKRESEKLDVLEGAIKDVVSTLDEVKTKLELNELKKDDPSAAETEESKDRLSESIDELKKELAKIAEDFASDNN